MAGTVPEFLAVSRWCPGCPGIYAHLALRLPLAWMAAPVSSVSSLVLFDTHKTTKAVRIHFLADKNFRQTILAPGVYVSSYKYLGIILSSNGSFKLAISTIAKQGSKALFSLFRTASQLSFPDPLLLFYLFDALVRPVLEYGNEILELLPNRRT